MAYSVVVVNNYLSKVSVLVITKEVCNFSESANLRGMSGINISLNARSLRVDINDGWKVGDMQGRTLTIIKNEPGEHNCSKELCSASTVSVTIWAPDVSLHKSMFERVGSVTLGCRNITADEQSATFTGSKEAAIIALRELKCVVLESYKDDWMPKVEDFLKV